MRRPLVVSLLLLVASGLGFGVAAAGCARRFEVRVPPPAGFDAAIVLGCPAEEDGRLSRCQKGRAAWAAELYRRGVVRSFVTSGAAVHTPYVEAEALAAAMTALGVPAERILLDEDALHTDENVWNGMHIAGAAGLRTLAVVSNKGHAAWACKMMSDWGQPCGAFSVDVGWVKAHAPAIEERLAAVRPAPVPDGEWPTLGERERQRSLETGHRRRPPSFLFYPYLGLARAFGRPWVPPSPKVVRQVTWAERLAERTALQPGPVRAAATP